MTVGNGNIIVLPLEEETLEGAERYRYLEVVSTRVERVGREYEAG